MPPQACICLFFSLGYTAVYLTTHDKQDFYAHIGYTYCDPVVSLGSASNLLSSDQVGKLNISWFPNSWKIMENLERDERIFHALENHGIYTHTKNK